MANIIEITDFNAPALDVYARLTENQLLNREHPEDGIFIAESPKVVERALASGHRPISLLMERKHIDGEARNIIAACGDIPVYTAEFDILTKLTGFQLTRGVLCAMRRNPLPTVEQVCANAARVAVLEDVMNPTNVGAIFRSAAALHMDAVLLTPACSNPLYRRAIRVSMGTVFQIPWTAAMALTDDSVSIRDPRLAAEERLAIVLGTEGDGLALSTISGCDYTVKIPMAPGIDSLNVAAASAVAFWQLQKQ